MESRFGHDFSAVRVHADGAAAQAAGALRARAFTVAEHVVFGRGHENPGGQDGTWLLAHELAHVVQQTGAPPSVFHQPALAKGVDALEQEAAVAADRVVTGQAVSVSAGRGGTGIQRAEEARPPGLAPATPCNMTPENIARAVAKHAARHQINPILVNDTNVTVRCEGSPRPLCHVQFSKLPVTVAVQWRTDVPWVVAGWDRPNGRKACRWIYRCEANSLILDPNADKCLEAGQTPAPPGGAPTPAPGGPAPGSGGDYAVAPLLSGPAEGAPSAPV